MTTSAEQHDADRAQTDHVEAGDDPQATVERARVTRALDAVAPEPEASADEEAASQAPADAPTDAPAQAQDEPPAMDPDKTVVRSTALPRRNTLAAMTRPRGTTLPADAASDAAPGQTSRMPTQPASRPSTPDAVPDARPDAVPDAMPDAVPDGIADEVDEWSVADQPTVQLVPGPQRPAGRTSVRPHFLDTDEQQSWPPLSAADVEAARSLRRRAIPRTDRTGDQRLAAPDGRPMPQTPPRGIPRSALPDPRMERFQELRGHREALADGEAPPEEGAPVTERVRAWWNDLRPGLQRALHYQHEARASGIHAIPAYEPGPPTSRLGDVFGRLAASAREFSERAQSAAGPALKRLHDQAEHAAQAIVGRFEGSPAQQQAPFLGPGRVAVFFRPGVTVGQAQRLLAASQARPMRIIPRKHGFLAYVTPGREPEVSERLRQHPYVRDVVYMEYDEYGDPVAG